MPKKDAEPRMVISLPSSVYKLLKDEQERMFKATKIHVSLAALIRKAVENTYRKQ